MSDKHRTGPQKFTRVVLILGMLYAIGSVGTAWMLSSAWPFQAHNPIRDFEVVDVRTADGVRLSVNQYIVKSRPLVVLAHDYHSSSVKFRELAPLLLEKGWCVLTFDFRGHGESEASKVGLGSLEVKDVDAILQHIRSMRGDLDGVAWLGVGSGAAAATLSHQARELECLALLDCYTDLETRLDRDFRDNVHVGLWPLGLLTGSVLEWRLGTSLQAVSPLEALRNLDGQDVLIVQGADDRHESGRLTGEVLQQAAGTNAELVLHIGDREQLHILNIENETRRAVMDFLAAQL